MAAKKTPLSTDPATAAVDGTAKKAPARKTAKAAANAAGVAEPTVKKAPAAKKASAEKKTPAAKTTSAKASATKKVAEKAPKKAASEKAAAEKVAVKKAAAKKVAAVKAAKPAKEEKIAAVTDEAKAAPGKAAAKKAAEIKETKETKAAAEKVASGKPAVKKVPAKVTAKKAAKPGPAPEPEELEGIEAGHEDVDDDVPQSSYDLAGKTKLQLIELLDALLAEKPVQALRRDSEAIKVAFYKLHRAAVEQQRRLFIEAGGMAEDFVAGVDEQEQRFKEVFAAYRKKRDDFVSSLERTKEESLVIKHKIIDDLKELISKGETLNHTFNAFRELQQRWRDTGPVPQTATKDIWETYNHYVEQFYNYIKINKELRDLDLKRNYEAKVALCEQAEALLLEPSIVSAFNRLQKLHEQWRDIGPVLSEYKETVWERFREASSRINKLHQEYFEKLKEEQKRNLDLKTELCVKAEELADVDYASRRDWNKASDKLAEIQKLWKTIGFAPKKDNTKIYDRFRLACDRFFEKKREFYSEVKDGMEENMQLKLELCIVVEGLKDSEEWNKATDEIIAMQKRWKEIGPVSRRHSDAVWKRFRAACDHFFERKSQQFSAQEKGQEDNLARKRAMLAELAAVDPSTLSFDMLKDFQRRWGEIGFVPIKQKEQIAREYKRLVDGMFDTLRAGGKERRMGNFRSRVADMRSSGTGRLQTERDRLIARVRQLEADIALLENNIGFFAKSKNSENIIAGVQAQIEKAREDMAAEVEKIKMIDKEQ